MTRQVLGKLSGKLPQGLGSVMGAAVCTQLANSDGAGRALGAGRRGCTRPLWHQGLGTCGHTGSRAGASCLCCCRLPAPSLQRGLPLWWGSGWPGGERLLRAVTSRRVRDRRESRLRPSLRGPCRGLLPLLGSLCLWPMIRKCPEIFRIFFSFHI